MSKKIAFKTLGCRLNLFETDSLMSEFAERGYEVTDDINADADVYIMNTCTVTNQSDQKSKRVMNRTNRLHREAVKIVTGCMATNYKDELLQSGKADYIVDNDHKTSIVDLVDAHFKGETADPDLFEKDVFSYEPARTTAHTRALIKIQDGCNRFCTYCIIPKVRGRAISRPAAEVLDNIEQVIGYGFKELVLTGVNLGTYKDGETDFETLVKKILEIPGNFRIRISSIEPDGFTESFFRLFHHPKLTPHLHLCLQSGSEPILKKMRRMYSAELFEKMCSKLREEVPGFNITTDIIVGFPGETEQDFLDSLKTAERIGFGHIHTFKFSVRKGTRAERLPDHVHGSVKTKRSEAVRKLSEKMRENYRKSFIGKEQVVLVEKINKEGYATGYGENYIPVEIRQKGLETNMFYKVTLTKLEQGKDEPVLIGEKAVSFSYQ
jgi:threonylcarbamoyladenosine tRNA methylthiotransferase MtaB